MFADFSDLSEKFVYQYQLQFCVTVAIIIAAVAAVVRSPHQQSACDQMRGRFEK